MPLCDHQIRQHSENWGLLDPFSLASLSSCGYDLRLGPDFKIPNGYSPNQLVDPFDPPKFIDVHEDEFIVIPSNSFVLGSSIEYVKMPGNLVGICLGRSTYARAGVISHVTPLEPGWHGNVTIEISNTNSMPVKVYVGRGITQVVFFRLDGAPEKNYAQKGGKYQFQTGVTQGRPDKV